VWIPANEAMSDSDSTRPVWKMGWIDLLWLLGYPIYQIFGTIRHEGSHALVATLEGATVTNFVFWPQNDLGRFTWGYVQFTGGTTAWTDAAPYLCDLIWFVAFFFIVTRLPIPNHILWINLVIVGLVSPLVNSLVQWFAGIFGSPQTDVAQWLTAVPDFWVHLYFILTIGLYVFGLIAVFFRVPKQILPAESG
jgi:hypothetical protein